jgi:signal transduction histidine kinase/CheY-like chemotaxis protein
MPATRIASVPIVTRTMAVVAGLLAMLFAVFLAIEISQLMEFDAAQGKFREGISTDVSQLEREYFRLLRVIDKSIPENRTIDRDAIALQFDLLASRVDIIGNASGAESLRQTSVYQDFKPRFEVFQRAFDGRLSQAQISKAELETSLQELEAMRVPINALTVRAGIDINEREENALGAMVSQHRAIVWLVSTQVFLFSAAGVILWFRSNAAVREGEKLRALANSLSDAKAQVELASKGKSQFLANMSHELRTPLNGMLGMLGLLDGTQLNAEQSDYVQTARRSSRHLLTLLNDVLDLSSIDAGKLSVKPELTHLASIFIDVEALVRPLVQSKNLDLRLHVDPLVPQWAIVDDTRFKQILLNLVNNAIKFSEVGSIDVTAFLQVETAPLHGELFGLQVSVCDQGMGMDDATRSRLFQRFEQGDAGTDRRFQGTGLGLEISRSLARLMHGDIAVESQKGAGSKFTVTVQLECADTPMPVSGCTSVEPKGMRKIDILVAEDNSTNRKYIGTLLTKMGHSVRFAEDGEQAVAQVNIAVPDVVLMDLHMPVMDGIEATKTLRGGDGSAAKVPIVALTADVWGVTKDVAIAAGMDAFLTKPVDTRALEKLLTSMFPWGSSVHSPQSVFPVAEAVAVLPLSPKPSKRFLAGDLTTHLNMPVLGEVCLVMGPKGMDDLAAEFGYSHTGCLLQLRQALMNDQTALLPELAHAVKGESAGLGLLSVSKVAHEVEKGGEKFNSEQCAVALVELDEAWTAGSALLAQLGMLTLQTFPTVASMRNSHISPPVPGGGGLHVEAAANLIQIIYTSNSVGPTTQHLTEIYESCLRNNHRGDITGILLVHEGRFMQLLEGPGVSVRSLFDVIRMDGRHTDISVCMDHIVEQRAVRDWSMGVCKVVPYESGNALSAPFFGNKSIDLRLMVRAGPVLEVLNAFSKANT